MGRIFWQACGHAGQARNQFHQLFSLQWIRAITTTWPVPKCYSNRSTFGIYWRSSSWSWEISGRVLNRAFYLLIPALYSLSAEARYTRKNAWLCRKERLLLFEEGIVSWD